MSAGSLVKVARAWQLVLPENAALTSLTAAELSGWWLPQRIPHPIFVSVPIGDRYPERKGLFVCRHPRAIQTTSIGGLTVTTGADTLLAAARDLGLLDLVIMGDSALRLGHCTMEDLQSAAASRRRGAPRLRTVLPLLDDRSESAWESIMRLLHIQADVAVEPRRRYTTRGADSSPVRIWLIGTR
ncbi:MAG TPA: hypothetical protein VJ625_11915, partial [Propionibacteriaceae bacterium]|nr:hypothetical protein [Propionibacteriaceae bacterium]